MGGDGGKEKSASRVNNKVFSASSAVSRQRPPPVSNGGAQVRTIGVWQEQYRQLCLQAWSAESDCIRETTQNSRVLAQDQLADMRIELATLDAERKKWIEAMWNDGLVKVRKRIRTLGRNVSFMANRSEVHRMVQAAEHDLHLYAEKSRQEYESLATQEWQLSDALDVALHRFEAWMNEEPATVASACAHRGPRRIARSASVGGTAGHLGSSSPSFSSRAATKKSSQKGLAAKDDVTRIRGAVDKLTKEIEQRGGPTGGWSTEDHDAFMKLFTKHKKQASIHFVDELQSVLPLISHEGVVAHVAWLSGYDKRLQEKKQLLSEWRAMKAVSATQRDDGNDGPNKNDTSTGNDSSCWSASFSSKEKRHTKEKEEQLQREQEERRNAVLLWRAEKADAMRINEEEEQRRLQDAEEKRSQERERALMEKRRILEEFRERKETEKRAAKALEMATRAETEALNRQEYLDRKSRITQRNSALLQKRIEDVTTAKSSKAGNSPPIGFSFAPIQRATSKSSLYSNVESRLSSHTESYVDRVRDTKEAETAEFQKALNASKYSVVPGNFAHQGLVRTTRSSPAWRAGSFGA